MTSPESAPAAPEVPPPSPPPPKQKRWKKILLISGLSLLGLLLLVLIAGPFVIASVVKSQVRDQVAAQLQADARIADASFSWSGHVQLSGFRLVPKNFSEPLLEVGNVDVKVDLLAAIGGTYLAAVEIVDPKILIEKGADGKFNYEFPAPATTEAPRSEAKPAGKPPVVKALLKISGGELRIRGQGRETRYRDLTLTAEVDTLEKPIVYGLSLKSPEEDLFKAAGSFDLNTRSGPATLVLERFSLKNLTGAARAYSDVAELDGTVTGALEYQIQGAPRFTGKGRLQVDGLAVVLHRPIPQADRIVKMSSLSIAHDGGIDEKGSGRQVITVNAGRALGATITANVSDAFGARAVKTDLKLDVDLAALEPLLRDAGALPADLKMAGALSVRGSCDSKGPTQADLDAGKPRVSASVDMGVIASGLDLSVKGQPMKLDRITLQHRGTLDESGNGKSEITLDSGKALHADLQVDVAEGLRVNAKLLAKSELGDLLKLLEKLIGLKADMALEGKAELGGSVEAKGADAARADFTLTATNLVAVDVKDKKRYELDPKIAARVAGSWDGKARLATADVVHLDSSFATLDGKGGFTLGKAAPEIHDSTLHLDADLGKLAGKLKNFMEKPPALGGRALVDAKAAGEKIGIQVALQGLKVDAYGPIDATLKDEGTLDAAGNGTQTLILEVGKAARLDASLALQNAYQESRRTSIDWKLDGDLGALAALLPGVVELKPGVALSGKAAASGRVELSGSNAASGKLDAVLTGLEALEKGKRSEIDPRIELHAAGRWDGLKKSASLDALSLTSSFATAEAKGGVSLADPFSVQESSLQLKADLEKLGARLGLLMPKPPALAGQIVLNGSYAGEDFALDATAKAVKYEKYGPIDATLTQKGRFSAAKGGLLHLSPGTLTSSGLDWKISGEIRSALEEKRQGELLLDLAARPLEISKWVPDLQLGGPEIRLQSTLALLPGKIALHGTTKLDGLTLPGRSAKTGPVEFSVLMAGEDVLADLKAASFDWVDAGYSARGGLDAHVAWHERGTTGTTKLTALEIVDDKKNVVKDPGLSIVHDVAFENEMKTVDLKKVDLSSTFLRGSITGRITGLDAAPEFLNLRAAFRYIPEKLGAVAKPWLPGRLEGSEEKTLDVTLNGKAASMDPTALLRGTRGTLDLDIARFVTDNGLSLSGKSRFELKDGRLTSTTPLQVNQGSTDLGASLDFREASAHPQSVLSFGAKDVDANANMGPILEHFNPIFHTVNGTVDGQIQSGFKLNWSGVIDPAEKDWVAAATRSLSGGGTFSTRNLSIAGSPAVAQILEVLGEGNVLKGELLATDIQIAGGKLRYKDMTIKLARYELRFTGWVGFDKKMELLVEMPLSEAMIKRWPNLQKYVGHSIFVPLKGRTDAPKLDVAKAVEEFLVRALLENALKKKDKDKK